MTGFDPEFTLDAITRAVVTAAAEIREGIDGPRNRVQSSIPAGGPQKAADVWADERFRERITDVEGVGAYTSDEQQALLDCGDGMTVTVDPIDGASNLTSNNVFGSIVGVYDATLPAAGESLVAAMCVVFGPLTTLTVARDGSVSEYTIDDVRLESETVLTIPETDEICGFGGHREGWPAGFRDTVHRIEETRTTRYSGSLVGDVRQILSRGGVFAYPETATHPDGKIEYLYEAAPVAYIVECAGGRTTDGTTGLLRVQPDDIGARTPACFGTPALVDRFDGRLTLD